MTDPTLKEYLEKMMAAQRAEIMATISATIEQFRAEQTNQDRAATIAIASMDRAVTKAESAVERRFESVNEFRKTLSDQAQTFLPRAEFNVQQENLNTRVAALERFRAEISGKDRSVNAMGTMLYSLIIASAALIGIIFTMFFRR